MGIRGGFAVLLLCSLASTVPAQSPMAVAATVRATARVSVGNQRIQGNGCSDHPVLSSTGRFVAWESEAPDLVPGDLNDRSDVFVRDRSTGITERVSVNSEGLEGNDGSDDVHITPDGRYVVFESYATNLVEGDSNAAKDVFLHDRLNHTTERLSVSSSGVQGNGDSEFPQLSASGLQVAFTSFASNLVPGDSNGLRDLFLRYLAHGRTVRLAVNADDAAISTDGTRVAFIGRWSLVPEDSNQLPDVYVVDCRTLDVTLVSIGLGGAASDGTSSDPAISADGNVVAFSSLATNLVAADLNGARDVFVRDLTTGVTRRVSVDSLGRESNGLSQDPSLSGDGRHVAFNSSGTQLVPADTNGVSDAFVHDRKTGITRRVSLRSDGAEGREPSDDVWISASGLHVSFESSSAFVAEDNNASEDVFDRGPPITLEAQADGGPGRPSALLAWGGSAGEPFALVLRSLDGVPRRALLRVGHLDEVGSLRVPLVDPPSGAVCEASFQLVALGTRAGRPTFERSNPVSVTLASPGCSRAP